MVFYKFIKREEEYNHGELMTQLHKIKMNLERRIEFIKKNEDIGPDIYNDIIIDLNTDYGVIKIFSNISNFYNISEDRLNFLRERFNNFHYKNEILLFLNSATGIDNWKLTLEVYPKEFIEGEDSRFLPSNELFLVIEGYYNFN